MAVHAAGNDVRPRSRSHERVRGVTGSAVASDDVRYAIERLFVPSVEASCSFYYGVLHGVEAFLQPVSRPVHWPALKIER
jgi:hypothetical protein